MALTNPTRLGTCPEIMPDRRSVCLTFQSIFGYFSLGCRLSTRLEQVCCWCHRIFICYVGAQMGFNQPIDRCERWRRLDGGAGL